jgi:hypothetical protein
MTDHQRGMDMSNAMIEAACSATILGEDEQGRPVHLSPEEARTALTAAISAYLAITEPGKPESGVLAVGHDMTDEDIRQWIVACNHEPARATLRHYLALRATPQQPLNLNVTKEWFERRAKAEADLEIGAGFSVVNMTDEDFAKMEVVAERALPQWAQDELSRLRSALSTPHQPALGVDIEALQRRVEELEAALKPFADASRIELVGIDGRRVYCTKEDLYGARSALIKEQKEVKP